MSWLKLDDAMVGHRKTRRLLRSQKAGLGLGAFGLHALGLLHCSKYLTDGFVEEQFITETLDDASVRGKNRVAIVDSLIAGGQWETANGGFLIHDYLKHNPSRAQVEAQRARDAARKQAGRATQSTGNPGGGRADGGRTADGFHSESDGPVPSRPVPSSPTTPLPPKGEIEIPAPPVGKRQRDYDAYDAELRAVARELLPDVEAADAYYAVKGALGVSPDRSPDTVRTRATTLLPAKYQEAA